MLIGIDLDNTIICYDSLAERLAVERGFMAPTASPSKREVKRVLWQLPDGDIEWQRLQALMYGERIDEAEEAPGFRDFALSCRAKGFAMRIISHKTRTSALGESQVDLHESARRWLRTKGFVGERETLFGAADVVFCESRQAKLDAIREARCCCFIDDLPEVFAEPEFPAGVRKLLYAVQTPSHVPAEVIPFSDWREAAALLEPQR